MKKPVVLMILDGWGISEETEGNAVYQGSTPTMDRLWADYPHCTLRADGEAVGLSEGQMGNSNVGHLNMGAGRVVYQDLVKIDRAIRDGSFYTNSVILEAYKKGKQNTLHLMGLLSDGGVHSHINHLRALLKLAKDLEIPRIRIHALLDGRDVPPSSGLGYLEQLEDMIRELDLENQATIATVMGRFYGMDRDNRWERTQLAYQALVEGKGQYYSSAAEAVAASYEEGNTDEFVIPSVIMDEDGIPKGTISEGDALFFFNFRADRARQISRVLSDSDFNVFERRKLKDFSMMTMTQYDETIDLPYAFPPMNPVNTVGEVVSRAGLTQLRIAETEKYAHVTFFFNGGEEKVFPGEDRILIPSPKVATYDLQPEMSALEVTDKVLEAISSRKFDFIVLNYANGDMVGHTGNMEAALKAVATVDGCVEKVVNEVLAVDGRVLILSDHGNVEQMVDYNTGEAHTAHTSNLVPCILVDSEKKYLLSDGILADVGPTLLDLLGIVKPEEMTAKSILLPKI